jgi:CDP-diacylglycerol--glycerol-3-phosphate 3-phosphatidyltransferase
MNLKNLNTAEWFAFSRFLTFPIVLLFIFLNNRILASWLFLIFFSTDVIDGIIARLFNQEGKRRAKLDSWGDILFLITGMVGFAWFETEFFLQSIGWILLPLSMYFVEMIYSLIKFKKLSNYHTYLAKITAFMQVFFIVFMLFFGPNNLVFGLAIFFSTIDPLEDIYITNQLDEWKANINGIWCL